MLNPLFLKRQGVLSLWILRPYNSKKNVYKILDDSRIQYPNRIIFATILAVTQGYKFMNDDIEAL